MKKTAIIIGAGPAGLTAAYELLTRTDIKPIIIEKSSHIGGICRTINYKGNRIDIGGHRFFSKSERVMNWWLRMLPLDATAPSIFQVNYRHKTAEVVNNHIATADPDKVMLVRPRVSHIYYKHQFFNYPVTLTFDTLNKLGYIKSAKIFAGYLRAKLFPRNEVSLEDFLINRFGQELYNTFFRDYTQKVWGVPCKDISAEWGAQRIKKLSIAQVLLHALRKGNNKEQHTGLIEQFLYPKYGPGQLWEEVAKQVTMLGGEIIMEHDADSLLHDGRKLYSLTINDKHGNRKELAGDYFFSTMPVKELVYKMQPEPPADVCALASGLIYRDFITVGLLLTELKIKDPQTINSLIKDTWIYIQEYKYKIGRLQVFNNWSPYMVADANTVWLGLEYFCNKGDALWNMPDDKIIALAKNELHNMGIIDAGNVLDSTLLRDEKTYPAYFGSYDKFHLIREYTDHFDNLYLVGRNGMHKYNNSDHSMLTAMTAVDNIIAGITDKSNIWAINTDQEYHEEENRNKM